MNYKNKEFQYCFFNKNICKFERDSLSHDFFNDLYNKAVQMLCEIEEQCDNYNSYKENNKIVSIFEWILGIVIPLSMVASVLGIVFEVLILLWVSTLFLIILIIIVLIVKIILFKKMIKLFKRYDNIAKNVISFYNTKIFHSKGIHITYKTNSLNLEHDEKNKQFWIEFYKISKVFTYDKKNDTLESFILFNIDSNKELSSIMANSYVHANKKQNFEIEDKELHKMLILKDEKINP